MVTMSLLYLGKKCQEYRNQIGFYQRHVADETGYSIESISAFENGRSDNARILLWYFEHGLTVDFIKGVSRETI